ncbi:MAG TPA: ATP-binding protein [Candidatus Binatia bacterium]|nr:ATP-binding protein [Candidatus Binatia bacterium]
MNTERTANILIVDDDPKTLLGMEALLSGAGRKIVTASSGQDALRWLLREEFALILLDVRMPGMDGFETADLIRQSERLRHIPIIFLSAIDTLEADVYRGAAKGAVDYLFKPVVSEVLKSKVSVFVDLFHINERLKQKAIQQSEERFRLLVESMEEYAIFMLDTEGRVTSWNAGAENIEGYKHEEIVGESFGRFYTPEDQAQGLPGQALRYAAINGRSEQEGWRVRKDGARFWANTIISALRDERRDFVGFSIVTRDLTNRKRVEEILRDSEAKLRKQAAELEQQLIASGRLVSLGEITASMAHEFNNPLGIVMGFTQELLRELESDNRNYRALKIIDEETRRCQRIIQELLEFARPRSAELVPTDIKLVIEKTVNMVANRFYKQNIEPSLSIGEDLPVIAGDPQQLEQVMVNLLLNAIDAMPNGGKLNVSASVTPVTENTTAMTIAVTDDGCGIEHTDLNRIFQPFFSAKKGKGMGLGLPISNRIISNHGGTIEVESEPGKGATFKIVLPVKQSHAESSGSDSTTIKNGQANEEPDNGQQIMPSLPISAATNSR